MSRKLFGTDGVRGVANQTLTPETAFQLGQAAGRWMLDSGAAPRAVIGRDTRKSGPMLGAALASGLCSAGIDVITLGIAPTPTVSFVARTGGFGLGAIISASHNPAPDNGIKFVSAAGSKFPDSDELTIESLIAAPFTSRPVGGEVGVIEPTNALVEGYLEFLEGIVPEHLAGMRVAVDGANGAAYQLGPEILRRLGAEVVVMGDCPNGVNINEGCGATKPEAVQEFVRETRSDVGVAFDGDADRAVFSDENGVLINGDRTMGIWSAHWRKSGDLDPLEVVGTVMSNGGFEHYLKTNGLHLHRAPVGDKYVAAKMVESGAKIGGEQSGHIIFARRGPTGDGLVTMLELLRVLKREGRPASAFVADYEPWPQVLINLSVDRREGWNEGSAVKSVLAEAESTLSGRGRVNVRPSGTQLMIRVMVEADSYEIRDDVAERVVAAMLSELGGRIYSQTDLTHALGD